MMVSSSLKATSSATRSLEPATPATKRTDDWSLTVLAVWALWTLPLFLFCSRYCLADPWQDESDLAAVCQSKQALTRAWLFQPEHGSRAPLLRLTLFALARMNLLDYRLLHFASVAMLSLGALALVVAVRAVRQRVEWSDVFLCLLVLSPWPYQALLYSSLSAAVPLALFCLVTAAILIDWPSRSFLHLGAFLTLLAMLALSAIPAGPSWCFGFMPTFFRGLISNPSRRWRLAAVLGGMALMAGALFLVFHWPSGSTAPTAGSTLLDRLQPLVIWVGPPLFILGPWALLLLALPLCGLAASAAIRVSRVRWDIFFLLFAAMLTGVLASQSHLGISGLFDSSFCATLIPVGVLTYLLVATSTTPRIVADTMALILAVCIGWNWHTAITMAKAGPPAVSLASPASAATALNLTAGDGKSKDGAAISPGAWQGGKVSPALPGRRGAWFSARRSSSFSSCR